jgi:hypothetical protein
VALLSPGNLHAICKLPIPRIGGILARQKAPHGTYSAYRRHLREHSEPCEACKAARKAYNKEHSPSKHGDKPARHGPRPARAPEHPEMSASSFFDAHLELEKTLTLIDQAVHEGLKDDPSKLGTLLKTRAEVVDRLASLSDHTTGEDDPFDALFDESRDVVRSGTPEHRETS